LHSPLVRFIVCLMWVDRGVQFDGKYLWYLPGSGTCILKQRTMGRSSAPQRRRALAASISGSATGVRSRWVTRASHAPLGRTVRSSMERLFCAVPTPTTRWLTRQPAHRAQTRAARWPRVQPAWASVTVRCGLCTRVPRRATKNSRVVLQRPICSFRPATSTLRSVVLWVPAPAQTCTCTVVCICAYQHAWFQSVGLLRRSALLVPVARLAERA
jgi:hypothetical protein